MNVRRRWYLVLWAWRGAMGIQGTVQTSHASQVHAPPREPPETLGVSLLDWSQRNATTLLPSRVKDPRTQPHGETLAPLLPCGRCSSASVFVERHVGRLLRWSHMYLLLQREEAGRC